MKDVSEDVSEETAAQNWVDKLQAYVRPLRDAPGISMEQKEIYTNILAYCILIRDEDLPSAPSEGVPVVESKKRVDSFIRDLPPGRPETRQIESLLKQLLG